MTVYIARTFVLHQGFTVTGFGIKGPVGMETSQELWSI